MPKPASRRDYTRPWTKPIQHTGAVLLVQNLFSALSNGLHMPQSDVREAFRIQNQFQPQTKRNSTHTHTHKYERPIPSNTPSQPQPPWLANPLLRIACTTLWALMHLSSLLPTGKNLTFNIIEQSYKQLVKHKEKEAENAWKVVQWRSNPTSLAPLREASLHKCAHSSRFLFILSLVSWPGFCHRLKQKEREGEIIKQHTIPTHACLTGTNWKKKKRERGKNRVSTGNVSSGGFYRPWATQSNWRAFPLHYCMQFTRTYSPKTESLEPASLPVPLR